MLALTNKISVKKLTSLKLIIRTMCYHSTKIAKIFWVTLDEAMHGASIRCPVHSYNSFFTVCAVAQHCCKGDERFQWEMPFFRVFQLRNPGTDFQKILHS